MICAVRKRIGCGSRRRGGRALAAFAAVALGAAALSGCGIHLNSTPGELPSLDAAQQARDDAARSESAVATMADMLATKATRCAPCRSQLAQVRLGSRERLRALGGLWSPWASPAPAGAQAPRIVADAPLAPTDLAVAMARDADRDLDAVAGIDPLDQDMARALAASAAGRLLAARGLARVYGVDLTAAVRRADAASPTPAPSWTRAASSAGSGAASPTSSDGVGSEPTGGDLRVPADSASLQSSGELSSAVRVYDCAARALYALRATPRAESLLARSTRLLDAGVKDARVERCRLADRGAPAVASAVLDADVDVAASASPAVRGVGVQMLREDASAWDLSWKAPVLPGAQVR